ncbi:MAG: glycosyltransferase [Candidatus Beckwithbacteria bacterium]
MKKTNRSIILLTVSDQQKNPLSQYPGVHLSCGFSTKKLWQGSLKKVFTRVIEWDIRKEYLTEGFQQTSKALIKLVRKYKPKYLIWPAYSDMEISEESFKKIRNLGTIIIGIFFDEGSTFESYSKYWLPSLDYVVTVDSNQSLKLHRALGIQAIFEPCCASSIIYKKKHLTFKYPVSFIGSAYGPRKKMVEDLNQQGIKVNTFGSGWQGRGYIKTEKIVKIFNQSRINLNFTNDAQQLRARMFEICMSGGFLLTQYAQGLEKLFKIGQEIESFHTISEAAQKINYYLKYDQARRQIAQAGYLRAQKDYSLEAMFIRIIKTIETGKVKKIKLKKFRLDEKIIKQRNLRFGYKHAALAIAGYSENKPEAWWQEEAGLAKSYKAGNMMLKLFYFYRLWPKSIAKLISSQVNKIFKLLQKFTWLQNQVVKAFYY